ncbi:DUF2279 domain-containing protein [Candidatus Kapabacteria bacterium]|nr:DUF2279 domain-containing protein [Candidatus Kapabacteria bacterium]
MKHNNQIPSQILIYFILLILLIFTNSNGLYSKDSLFIPKEEFKYANSYRYTLFGEQPRKETTLNPLRTGLVIGGITTLFTVQHIAQSQTIWKEGAEFKIQEDGAYSLYVDKPGHFLSGYTASYIFGEAMYVAGMKPKHATLFGGMFGWLYLNYIEVMDGFGANFGFSPTDVYFNTAGSAFYILQYYYPYLQNITPKFTMLPADWHGQYRREGYLFIVDDYSSQSFWLSFNIHNMLPDNLKDYWPSWIDLSLGYAVRNICNECNQHDYSKVDVSSYNWGNQPPALASPKYIVALDFNLTQILPDKGPGWLNWTKQTLNLFKWPSPAIEFSKDAPPRYFLLYPFAL